MYVIVLRRINDYGYNNGAPLVAFYDTLWIRRTHSRLKPQRPHGGSTNDCVADNYVTKMFLCLADSTSRTDTDAVQMSLGFVF